MAKAKEGKVDAGYFKNMVHKREETEKVWGPSGIYEGEFKFDYISGWILNFFAYLRNGSVASFKNNKVREDKFKYFANQMLVVPFILTDTSGEEYWLKYKVGFFGCEQNEKNEVSPVQGWFVSPMTDEDYKSIK